VHSLGSADVLDRGFHHRGHALMHRVRVIAFDEERRPAATAQELLQFLALDAREHRGIADLVAIQVQIGSTAPSVTGSRNLLDCQEVAKGPVSASPSPITQATISPGIVKGGAKGVAQGITQFAAFVNRSGSRRRHMARNAAGKENCLNSSLSPASSWVTLGYTSLHVPSRYTLPTIAGPP
jgi:hypothetical protein